jgi:AcrR family transcriptional regulator
MVPPRASSAATAPGRRAPWVELDIEAKRKRVLDVAQEVFTEHGLDATMPRIAEAAGIGVGSLYRSYQSKEDLIAALVVHQLRRLESEVSAADEDPDAWTGLEQTVRLIAMRQSTNKLLRGALGLTSERPDVAAALGGLSLAWQQLIDRARGQGTVRSDATVTDLRFVFAAVQAAEDVEAGGRERMLTLLLEALAR